MRANWEKIRSKLEDGTYKPFPVRSVSIPKDGGGRRPLGIPTVLDRVIQQAIAQVLTVSFVILCGSLRAGERILRGIRCFLADELKLIVNETKSRVVPLAEARLLPLRSTLRAAWRLAVSLRSAPRVPNRAAQGALDEEEPEEVQSESQADHKTDAGTLAEDSDCRTDKLPPGGVQLLRRGNRIWRGPGTGSVGAKSRSDVLLEAVGQAEDAAAQTTASGDWAR